MDKREFKVLAVTLFGKIQISRHPTREQAEWRIRELEAEAERNPRSFTQYVIEPAEPHGAL